MRANPSAENLRPPPLCRLLKFGFRCIFAYEFFYLTAVPYPSDPPLADPLRVGLPVRLFLIFSNFLFLFNSRLLLQFFPFERAKDNIRCTFHIYCDYFSYFLKSTVIGQFLMS